MFLKLMVSPSFENVFLKFYKQYLLFVGLVSGASCLTSYFVDFETFFAIFCSTLIYTAAVAFAAFYPLSTAI